MFEVKALTESLGGVVEFELGETEIRTAQVNARNDRYRILLVTSVLDPQNRQILQLPNPFSKRGQGRFRVVGRRGLRYQCSPLQAVTGRHDDATPMLVAGASVHAIDPWPHQTGIAPDRSGPVKAVDGAEQDHVRRRAGRPPRAQGVRSAPATAQKRGGSGQAASGCWRRPQPRG
jgi:hypothetical protein